MELSINGEDFGISPSRKVLSFHLNVSIPGDFIRVITRPAPAPSSLVIFVTGFVSCGWRRRARA